MRKENSSIIIAWMFILMLCITTTSFFVMIGGRSVFVANKAKRAQAIYYTEAALYEAFTRFRNGTWDPATLGSDTINVNGVDVDISVTGTGPTGTDPPYTVSAKVDYEDITY